VTDAYHDLQQSYGRCLRDHGFIDRFYETLLASDPRIPPMFARTDMGRQRVAMRRGVSVAILHAAGSTLARRSVEKMADVHGKAGHAPVPPYFHALWLESLLRVIADTDPEADATLLMRWRRAMGMVVDTFTRRYEAAPAPGIDRP
jgi:hemoglobin-like flavoprotein